MSALVLVLAAGGFFVIANRDGGPARDMKASGRYCFAEWCIAPESATIGIESVSVDVRISSDARQASQRPDHPQVWVIDESGRQAGGPQGVLDRQIGPGESYTATLDFSLHGTGGCPRLVVSEGGWPPFLGLGYAASPFTARARWRLCDIPVNQGG